MGCEMTTGEKILELRNKKRISQDRLAEMLGVTRQAVSKWELDETLPDIENAIKIANLFETSLEYLFITEAEQKKESKTSFVNKYDSLDFLACTAAAGVSATVMVCWIIRLLRTVFIYLKITFFSVWEREFIHKPGLVDLFNSTVDEMAVIFVLASVIYISLRTAKKLNKK